MYGNLSRMTEEELLKLVADILGQGEPNSFRKTELYQINQELQRREPCADRQGLPCWVCERQIGTR